MRLNSFFEYRCDFSILDRELKSDKARQQCYERFISKYRQIYKSSNDNTLAEWHLRCEKSQKESVVSAMFFSEAEIAFESGNRATFFYLLYYSLFHGLLSSLYLSPLETETRQLLIITHSKIINSFNNSFDYKIKDGEIKKIKEHFEMLQYLREYHSYHFPLNYINFKELDAKSLLATTKNYLTFCFQYSNFLSHCLHKVHMDSAKKREVKIQPDAHFIYQQYHKLHIPLSPTETSENDFYDVYALDDNLRWGVCPSPHDHTLEHVIDECHYEKDKWTNGEALKRANTFLYKSIS